eukprot:scaffold1875_cov253-Pinguiococcus_pyrenoidosus.AAC.22
MNRAESRIAGLRQQCQQRLQHVLVENDAQEAPVQDEVEQRRARLVDGSGLVSIGVDIDLTQIDQRSRGAVSRQQQPQLRLLREVLQREGAKLALLGGAAGAQGRQQLDEAHADHLLATALEHGKVAKAHRRAAHDLRGVAACLPQALAEEAMDQVDAAFLH